METNISMADFYEKYQNENLELIDVREVHEFQAGHAPGAKNLPLSTLEQGYKNSNLTMNTNVHLSRWSAFCLCLPISQRPRPHRYQCRRWHECLARSSRINNLLQESITPIQKSNRYAVCFCMIKNALDKIKSNSS